MTVSPMRTTTPPMSETGPASRAAGCTSAMRSALVFSRKPRVPMLASTADHKGVTGTISFDEKGDIKNGALTLKTYKGGKQVDLAVIR